MASLEILDYRYTNSWDLDKILTDKTFNKNIQPHFPIIATTETGISPDLQNSLFDRFFAGKTRGRPKELYQTSPDSTLLYVAECLGTASECFISNATCSSSSYGLFLASLISLEKKTPVILFCGDSLNSKFNIWRFKSFGALDQDTGFPFDKSSKGFRIGSGAAVLIVKHPDIKFNIDPLAFIKNFYFHTNPKLISHPGSVEEIIQLFNNINFKNYDFWNAHATGTPVGDIIEYEIFKSLCNENVPIVSYKHYIGHCMCGSTVLEILMAIDGKKQGVLSPNIIKQEPIVNDNRIITSPIKWPGNNMIKASFGFGGRTSLLEIELL